MEVNNLSHNIHTRVLFLVDHSKDDSEHCLKQNVRSHGNLESVSFVGHDEGEGSLRQVEGPFFLIHSQVSWEPVSESVTSCGSSDTVLDERFETEKLWNGGALLHKPSPCNSGDFEPESKWAVLDAHLGVEASQRVIVQLQFRFLIQKFFFS